MCLPLSVCVCDTVFLKLFSNILIILFKTIDGEDIGRFLRNTQTNSNQANCFIHGDKAKLLGKAGSPERTEKI